ncbi:MAG TPA: hypothetical protein VN636_00430 [Acidimicrobiia bacterium]|nr:hypothetical protein [Acidimicrobiia bacterium]
MASPKSSRQSVPSEASSSPGPAINIAVVAGTCSSPAEVRVLPSEQVLVQLQVSTRLESGTVSVPVAVLDPPAWVEALDSGDDVIVVGRVRRRFFRAAGATASRVEVEAAYVARPGDRRRGRAARRRVEAALEPLEG